MRGRRNKRVNDPKLNMFNERDEDNKPLHQAITQTAEKVAQEHIPVKSQYCLSSANHNKTRIAFKLIIYFKIAPKKNFVEEKYQKKFSLSNI